MVTLPLLSGQSMPAVVKVGLTLLLTVFLATLTPIPAVAMGDVSPLAAILLLVQEIVLGLALGLAANLIFMGVQQGARIIAQQMGLTDAEIIDPVSGESSEALSLFFEMTFALLFLAAGGHHLLLYIIAKSYAVFPVGHMPDMAALAQTLVKSGAIMLLLGIKLAAPMLAAFLVLAVVLALIARLLPDMNILMASYPLRIGLGLFMAAAIVPFLSSFVQEVSAWMGKLLA
jgi:flagellar biosynthetic protein FliR